MGKSIGRTPRTHKYQRRWHQQWRDRYRCIIFLLIRWPLFSELIPRVRDASHLQTRYSRFSDGDATRKATAMQLARPILAPFTTYRVCGIQELMAQARPSRLWARAISTFRTSVIFET